MSSKRNLEEDCLHELNRIIYTEEKRGYPSYWHADKKSQFFMEVDATRCWAKEMNKQGWTIRLCATVKNEGEFPDCICKTGEQRLGVEVTEFTNVLRRVPADQIVATLDDTREIAERMLIKQPLKL